MTVYVTISVECEKLQFIMNLVSSFDPYTHSNSRIFGIYHLDPVLTRIINLTVYPTVDDSQLNSWSASTEKAATF